ncbi:MAG TPA: flagellar basal body rod protein FlgB [Devosiaceae bacterium]|jgi:flagellar basal-body rod protein FlgB|nr:flagellar basal body rod protein FlgB [Devosiaceae bacterium]
MDAMSLLNSMVQKMQWQQQRQDLLSQNVANADTPNYAGEELKPITFGEEEAGASPPMTMAVTNPSHFSFDSAGQPSGPGEAEQQNSFEMSPEGNGVTLEDEMMKVTANQLDYQAVTTLYSKSLALITTAIGQ